MKLFSCYHPIIVHNKYTGEEVVARCGKCPACINARAANWVQRLDVEVQNNKFAVFFTLQYDEQHVPQMLLMDKCDWPNGLPAYIDSQTGQVIDLFDVPHVDADIQYCLDTKVLLVHDVRPFQLFFKKLRNLIKENFPNERIRYYMALEYGPTTFRPHSHCLLFFNETLLTKNYKELLSMSWPNGNVFGAHIVSGSNTSYVASYLNSNVHLPAILKHPHLRQRALFSKRPPIGCTSFLREEDQLFHSSDTDITLFRKSVSQFLHVPMWRSLSNRLYPRIVGFNRLSHYDRVILYQYGKNYESPDWKQYVFRRISIEYWLPFYNLFVTKKISYSSNCVFNDDAFQRFLSSIRRVARNAARFGVSIEYYVTKIESFYDELYKKQVTDWYYLQDEYFQNHPISDFLALNPNFCLSVFKKHVSELQDWQLFYLQLYDPAQLSKDVVFIDYKKISAYKSMLGLHSKIFSDNTKQKQSNDYLLAKKDKFNNILTYNQLLSYESF